MKVSNIFYLIIVTAVFLTTSCSEENLEPGIPSFILVEPFEFDADFASEGTSLQQIKDVWVFADGATIGVFELPANIPVLKEGTGELRLEPGIEINGIATTRINNPFFEPQIIEAFNFIPDSVVRVTPTSTYRPSTVFPWIEDFEDPSVSLDTTNLGGNTQITRVSGDLAFEGSFSGQIFLDSIHNTYEAATFDSYQLPKNGQPVVLEMHYKNDYYFSVGIIEESINQVIKSEIIILYPSEEWNKIYINFTDKVRGSSATTFKVLVRTYLEEPNQTATIQLDNMKLMYR